ncbi:hypothetical protein D9619_012397 [Psilocybe cf. subviscida]|uniref:Chromo domain-containing protein n=1 Tax=Psilocybe cf. subviscida TaxID=2480587 RepID=A0A8H5ERA4_9AGAR|nr:hypothetical protein D9619_012397 [Psilocybe cf. subviscida]
MTQIAIRVKKTAFKRFWTPWSASATDHSSKVEVKTTLEELAARLLRKNEDNSSDVATELLALARRLSEVPLGAGHVSFATARSPDSCSLNALEVYSPEIGHRRNDDGQGSITGGNLLIPTILTDNQNEFSWDSDVNPHFQEAPFDIKLPVITQESEHQARVHTRTFFGTTSVAGQAVPPIVSPLGDEFLFSESELCTAPRPGKSTIQRNPEALAPADVYYPLAPAGGYDLRPSQKYMRGFAYVAAYDLNHKLLHRELLLKTAVPPDIGAKLEKDTFTSVPLPGMVEMVPGVPFAFAYNGDSNRLHTVGCAQTLKSLCTYPDYSEILENSVKLAKLTWGCKPHGKTPAISPIYELPGLKVNDRSSKRASFHHHSQDGSYSLSGTVIKGEGQGTFAPAVQANTTEARLQISSVLQTLHTLYRLVMPKCISKFEMEITDFQSVFNNVFGFGGLGPNGTSVQLNISSVNIKLGESLGAQGGLHCDRTDCKCRFTFLTLLYRICPSSDPGPFCLARPGLYIRERDVWIQFLVFKGVDLHFGHEPTEDDEKRQKWILENPNSAWNRAGTQNRAAYVTYFSDVASNRTGSLNVLPPTHFGNYGSSQVHKDQQKNFGFHGHAILGTEEEYANKLAREIIYNFWNSLQVCNLDLELELEKIFESISFQDHQGKAQKRILPPKYLPDQDKRVIQKFTSLWAWHLSEAEAFFITLPKTISTRNLKRPRPSNIALLQTPFTLPSGIPALQDIAAGPSSDISMEPPSSRSSRKIIPLRKSKKSGKSSASLDVPASGISEQVYEVEEILTHKRNGDGSYSWCVRWKGYNETAWLGDKELGNCIELLYKYNEANKISVKSINAEINATSESTQEKIGPKAKRRQAGSSVSLAENLKTLDDLFDLTHLEDEVNILDDLHRTPKSADYFKNINMQGLVEKWGGQVEETRNLGDLLVHEEGKCPSGISIGKVLLRLKTVQVALGPDYRPIDTLERKVDVIKRSAKHEICLALISVYEWYSHTGPLAAQHIANTYIANGYGYLKDQSSSLADITDHIAQYAWQILEDHRKDKQLKKKLVVPTHSFGLDLSKTAKDALPANLYGLIGQSGSKPSKLPDVPKSVLNKLEIAPTLEHCLEEVISKSRVKYG